MSFRTDKRYYLTADGKAVEEGDPAGQSLLFGMDAEVSAADAKKYGIKEPSAPSADAEDEVNAEPDAESGAKARSAPPANKARAQSESK